MEKLLEVLVTCDGDNNVWTCCIWNARTGTSLMTYKGGGIAESRSLAFIGKDYIAATEKNKPLLHIWPINSQQTVQGMRFVLPGKANCFDVSSDGAFCIAGIEDKIYLWQISSGSLLSIISRHYQSLTVLKFTPDGKYFISTANDGMVMVWAMTTVAVHPGVELVSQNTAGQYDPVHIFSDHSLPVTDLHISKMGMHGRLCTVSLDRTSKIYNLATGELLLNLIFDIPLTSVTMDVLELNLFVGTAEGKIHQFCLTNPPRNKDYTVIEDNTFIGHSKSVTCLSPSLDGETLMSASLDKQVLLWHIPSKQVIRTIGHKGPVTNAFFALNNPRIYKQDSSQTIILHNLQKTLQKDMESPSEIEILTQPMNFWQMPVENVILSNGIITNDMEQEFIRKELKLKEEIENLKKINANLYEFSMEKAIRAVPVDLTHNQSKKRKRKLK